MADPPEQSEAAQVMRPGSAKPAVATHAEPAQVCIVGGGIIGLSIAWRAARAGLSATVLDPDPGSGASHVAAGMLAAVSEAHWGEEGHVDLNLASARLWPSFAAELEEASERSVGFSPSGTLMVGFDRDDMAVVDDLGELHSRLGLATTRLRGRECRAAEPLLSPSTHGGVLVPGDHHVDPRAVVAALEVALRRAGGTVVAERVERIRLRGDRVAGVELATGQVIEAPSVVLAAGAWSSRVGGLPAAARPPVRPVKGQLLVLAAPSADLAPIRPVRGWVKGSTVYVVPRDDGRVVVGATQEERGFDTTVTAGAVHDLLRDAALLLPALLEHELVEALAGLRPGTADNRPLIGPVPDVAGLLQATGHHRNGVLLAPITADLVLDHLLSPDLLGAGTDPVLRQRGFEPDEGTSSVKEAS